MSTGLINSIRNVSEFLSKLWRNIPEGQPLITETLVIGLTKETILSNEDPICHDCEPLGTILKRFASNKKLDQKQISDQSEVIFGEVIFSESTLTRIFNNQYEYLGVGPRDFVNLVTIMKRQRNFSTEELAMLCISWSCYYLLATRLWEPKPDSKYGSFPNWEKWIGKKMN